MYIECSSYHCARDPRAHYDRRQERVLQHDDVALDGAERVEGGRILTKPGDHVRMGVVLEPEADKLRENAGAVEHLHLRANLVRLDLDRRVHVDHRAEISESFLFLMCFIQCVNIKRNKENNDESVYLEYQWLPRVILQVAHMVGVVLGVVARVELSHLAIARLYGLSIRNCDC